MAEKQPMPLGTCEVENITSSPPSLDSARMLPEHLVPTSGRERVGKVFNRRQLMRVRPRHGDDIETSPVLQQIVAFEISERQPSQATLFFRTNRFNGVPRMM